MALGPHESVDPRSLPQESYSPCPPPLARTCRAPSLRTPRSSPAPCPAPLVPPSPPCPRFHDRSLKCGFVKHFRLCSFTPVPQSEPDMSSPLIYDTPSRGTPVRQRADLGSVRKAPQVDLNSEPVSQVNLSTGGRSGSESHRLMISSVH